MKKWLSKLLVVMLVFSLTVGNTNAVAQAATTDKTQNKQIEDTQEQKIQNEESKVTQENVEEKNKEANVCLDYNGLHGDNSGISNYSGVIDSNDYGYTPSNLTSSNVNMIVMLIDFPTSDSDPNKGKVTINKTYTSSQIEQLTSSFYGNTRSLKNFVSTVSDGKCSVNPVLTYDNGGNIYVYTADHPLEYYLPYSSSNPIGYKNGSYYDRTQLFSNAFAALKKYIPSDLNLDVNNDGEIDSIDFFTSYCGNWNDFLWSHSWNVMDRSQKANGASLIHYNQITYPNYNSGIYRTISHEYMHIIGFPDMYTYGSSVTFSSPFDSWTPMTYGTTGHPTVWERYKYGDNWISPSGVKTIDSAGVYTLDGSTTDSSKNTVAYKIKIPGSKEFFMIEYRDRSASVYESDMPASGIIAYRVNPYTNGNSYGDPELYQLRNEGQSCSSAYLNGTTDHKTLELKDYDGNKLGKIEFVSMSNGQASFKLMTAPEIKQFTQKDYYKNKELYNNQVIVGSKVILDGELVKAQAGVEFKYSVKDPNGNVTNLNNSSYSQAYWTPNSVGKYTLTLTVKDEDGNASSKSVDIYVKDKISVSSVSINKKAPQPVGTKIEAALSMTGGIGTLKCIAIKAQGGNYQFGSKELYFTMTTNYRGYWIPDTEGEYNLYATIQDEAGDITQVKIGNYTVGKNEVTIYYSGYTNPYIHYQIGNGSWTQAPGIKMEASNEVEGYSYKTSIDLDSADKLTACFNNGNGSWDNNGGRNYTFEAGYYTLKNGVITKIDKPTSKLSISSLTTNYPKGVSGLSSVNIYTAVQNAEGTVQYTYTDVAADGTTKVISANTTNSTISWIPSSYGKHTIKVEATDGVTTATKSIEFYVNQYVKATITGPNKISVGKAATFTINATGGTGKLTYSFYYTEWPSYNKVMLQSSDNNTLVWTPKETGTYQLWYSIADEGGDNHEFGCVQLEVEEKTEAKTVIYYKGYDNPYIHYRIGNGSWTQAPGVKMSSSNDVDGYTHMIEVDLGDADKLTACFNNGSGSWDSNNGNNYTFNEGYYTYSNGKITKIEKPSTELKISSITCDKGDTIKYGDTANFTINAKGGSGVYTYSMTTTLYGSGRTLDLLSNSTSNTASWKPDYPRIIYITATVTDSTGATATYTEHFTVKEVSKNEITIYYKGYDNAYIHYKVGNGTWTQAPGVAMTKTSEKSGYTHKITIDLGDAENITACFNNGNGSWDSNNGNNYFFNGVGTYTYSNGIINKIS